MAKNNRVILKFRRQREGITDYKKRLNLLKSDLPRLIIRKSLNHVTVQFAEFRPKGDSMIISLNSKALEKLGWKYKLNNLPAAYLTGLLAGKKAKQKIKKAVADIGRIPSTRGSRIYAAIKGVKDAGIDVSVTEEVLPQEERITGKHIEEYAKKLKKESPKEFEKRFSKKDVDKITDAFDKIKKKITSE